MQAQMERVLTKIVYFEIGGCGGVAGSVIVGPRSNRNYLRILWYKDNDPDKELIDYRMRVHVFGNSPSPAVAPYGLRKCVEQELDSSEVKMFIENDFYVDDGLSSSPTVEQVVDLMQKTQDILRQNGNLHLHKIASNSAAVLNAFPPDDLAKELKDLDLSVDTLPSQRSLGVVWNLESDTFGFKVSAEEKDFTKRGVLSTINSLYDPMGLVAPVIIRGKIIMREILTGELGWDDPIPEVKRQEWEDWRNSLHLLEEFHVPRTFVPVSLQNVKKKQVYLFSDASELAIAAVAYLKTTDFEGNQNVGFILGKAKVAPSGGHTIPRLELCAEMLAVDIADFLSEELDIPLDDFHYFTDSKIVLGYIYNKTRRFYTYVANRVERIRRSSKSEQWGYVSTGSNLADQATRSIPASLMTECNWISGPLLLLKDEAHPDQAFHLDDPDSDKEVRPQVVPLATKVKETLGTERCQQFSSWKRLVQSFSLLKQAVKSFHAGEKVSLNHTCTASYSSAEEFIIRAVQQENYGEEMKCLERQTPLPKNSRILALNPIIDDKSI